jgi:hypothetical protein
MKPGYANVVSFGLALATLSSTRAATTRPPNTPAVWIAQRQTGVYARLSHLKNQIFDWLENVRSLWFEWRRPVAPRSEAEDRAMETVH